MASCDVMWQAALGLLAELQDVDMEADVISLNSAMSSCSRAEQWPTALRLLHSGLRGDAVTCSALLASCVKGEQWLRALDFFKSFRTQIRCDAFVYAGALCACESTGWGRALVLFQHLRCAALEACAVSRNSALNACAAEWRTGLALAAKSFDCDDYNAMLSACAKGQRLVGKGVSSSNRKAVFDASSCPTR